MDCRHQWWNVHDSKWNSTMSLRTFTIRYERFHRLKICLILSMGFYFPFFSCRCCCIFFMLGTIPCSTTRRYLWKYNRTYWNLQCHDLYIRYNVLRINVHQSTFIQYHEQQIPRRIQGKLTIIEYFNMTKQTEVYFVFSKLTFMFV